MVKGINTSKQKKKSWKTKMERDVYLLREAYLQHPESADSIKKSRKKSNNKKIIKKITFTLFYDLEIIHLNDFQTQAYIQLFLNQN
jgi:asparagine synthetase B (glutamine-hydrolysing)